MNDDILLSGNYSCEKCGQVHLWSETCSKEEEELIGPPISGIESCPFCGSNLLAIGYDGQPALYFYVRCGNCKAQGPKINSASATGGMFNDPTPLWNKRKYRLN